MTINKAQWHTGIKHTYFAFKFKNLTLYICKFPTIHIQIGLHWSYFANWCISHTEQCQTICDWFTCYFCNHYWTIIQPFLQRLKHIAECRLGLRVTRLGPFPHIGLTLDPSLTRCSVSMVQHGHLKQGEATAPLPGLHKRKDCIVQTMRR